MKAIKKTARERAALTAREETMLLLLRELSPHQQREEIIRLQALAGANRVARRQLKGPLETVSNETVRAAYKDVPDEPQLAHKRRKKKPGRDLGDAMGDYLDD